VGDAGWAPTAFPVELFSPGLPLRASLTSFGPILLAKVLDLNETQESALALIFHWADTNGLALLDLADLRAVIAHLSSPAGKAELEGLGGIARSTAGVILREVSQLVTQGADEFFGEPELDTQDLMRSAGPAGVISLLELTGVQDRPALFSTFVMWLLADLYGELPEVGDLEKPKLVFFFDEAHLLFTGASKDFLAAVVQTVRLVRSKGVSIFFVTPNPTDVPDDVLAQLGNRVQHALRAFTPADADALRKTDGPDLSPDGGLRPRGGAHRARDGGGGRHRALRARGADPGRLVPHAGAALADGPGGPGDGRAARRGLAAARPLRRARRPRVRLRTADREGRRHRRHGAGPGPRPGAGPRPLP
jgi:Bacterial protein of unknown function (DUF853)